MANEHVTDYLNYYFELENPQYAVLLIGKWGCGKTYYIKNMIHSLKNSDDSGNNIILKPIYLSLNGIDEINTVNNKIKSELSSFLTKAEDITKKVLKGLIRTSLKIDLDWNNDGNKDGNLSFNPDLIDIFRSKNDHIKGQKILIFDDLERCKIETDKLFGYINNFVEHFGCKVVLLSDEEKLQEKYKNIHNNKDISYKDFKEKLIGQTFRIRSELTTAVNAFISECEKNYNSLDLTDCKELIIRIYNTSQKENLRVLRQALLDFYRFTDLIDYTFKNHARYNEFIKHFLAYFLIVNLEFRTGNEQIDKFQNYISSYLNNNDEDNSNEIEDKKYYAILEKYDIYHSLHVFPIDKIIQYLKNGYIAEQQLNSLLESNIFFLTDKTQNWEKLWRWRILDDRTFREIRDIVWKDFTQGNIKDPLIVTHIAGTLISLIDEKLLNKNKKFVVTKAKQIMNRLCTIDFFKENNNYGLFSNARDYNAESSVELNELIKYLHEKKEEGRKYIYNNHIRDIFENLQEGDVFSQIHDKLTVPIPDYSTQYEGTSIFNGINGGKLGKKIKLFKPRSIYSFKDYIHYRYYPEERYTNVSLNNYHKDDKQCLTDLANEISRYSGKRDKIKIMAISDLFLELVNVIRKIEEL